ncbi:UNVERIFIED_CONTAM: hypothetical protein BJ099_1052 [Lysinibacillus xylanilyticus]
MPIVPDLNIKEAEQLAKSQYVKDYNYITSTLGISTLQNETEDLIDKIDVSVTGEDLGKMGGIGLGIAILATLLPALSILRLNPKQILLINE